MLINVSSRNTVQSPQVAQQALMHRIHNQNPLQQV